MKHKKILQGLLFIFLLAYIVSGNTPIRIEASITGAIDINTVEYDKTGTEYIGNHKFKTAGQSKGEEWEKLYADYMDANLFSYNSKTGNHEKYKFYSLIYVDNDNIPEIYCRGNYFSAGDLLLYISNGEVKEKNFYQGGLRYAVKKGLLTDHVGRKGCYEDKLYRLKNGNMVCLEEGSYRAVWNEKTQSNRFGGYRWNGKKITKKKYTAYKENKIEEVMKKAGGYGKIVPVAYDCSDMIYNIYPRYEISDTVYQNDKFGYRVEYPKFFKKSEPSLPEREGVFLKYQNAILCFYGDHNMIYTDGEELRKYRQSCDKEMSAVEAGAKSLYYEIQDGSTKTIHYTCFVQGGHISMMLAFPAKEEKEYKTIADKIIKSMNENKIFH